MSDKIQIICRDLAVGYDGARVCEGIDLSIDAGDYLCIVGDNGSGKSTFMKTLLKLNAPICGEIKLCNGISQHDIGYLPQRTEIQKDFPASVLEIVRSGCVGRKGFRFFIGKSDRARVEKNMRCTRISDLASRPFSKLSGGQQQRVLLARALCATERILLLDEPIAGLDPDAAREMYGVIQHLKCDHGTTIIMITHDLEAVKKYATKVLHMSDKPTFYTSAAEFFAEHPIHNAGGNKNEL